MLSSSDFENHFKDEFKKFILCDLHSMCWWCWHATRNNKNHFIISDFFFSPYIISPQSIKILAVKLFLSSFKNNSQLIMMLMTSLVIPSPIDGQYVEFRRRNADSPQSNVRKFPTLLSWKPFDYLFLYLWQALREILFLNDIMHRRWRLCDCKGYTLLKILRKIYFVNFCFIFIFKYLR